MNVILIKPDELDWLSAQPNCANQNSANQNIMTTYATVVLSDWRAKHIIEILRAQIGDSVKIGIFNGKLGIAHITSLSQQSFEVTLKIKSEDLSLLPPCPAPVRLFIALPRPKAARRIVQLASECGVKELHFFHCFKVEKSYWSSPLLQPVKLEEHIVIGLQQSVDTRLMNVHLHQRFKPFVEDQLPVILAEQALLIAHPAANALTKKEFMKQSETGLPLNIMLGPEGGFIPYELDKLMACNGKKIGLGERIYRTEIATALLLGKLKSLAEC